MSDLVFLKRFYKGIYIKSAPSTGTGEIRNVLYENITIANESAPNDNVTKGIFSFDFPEGSGFYKIEWLKEKQVKQQEIMADSACATHPGVRSMHGYLHRSEKSSVNH